LSAYTPEGRFEQMTEIRSVIGPRYKYVWNLGDLEELYDTAVDTAELHNRAGAPALGEVRRAMRTALQKWMHDLVAFERNMRSVRALRRDVALWSTNSRWLLADLAVGADGILSGMGSIAADLHVALAEAVWRSDLIAARRINNRIFPLTQVFYRPGGDHDTRMKYALKRLGRWKNDFVRPPLKPLDDAERAEVDRALKESGLDPPRNGHENGT
jgi:hypothetical protein